MRGERKSSSRCSWRIKITLISGQTIPKQTIQKTGQGDGEFVELDPYVVIKIYGHPNDKQKRKSTVVKSNGKLHTNTLKLCHTQVCYTESRHTELLLQMRMPPAHAEADDWSRSQCIAY